MYGWVLESLGTGMRGTAAVGDNDRLQQKNDLYVKLGALLGPLEQAVAHPERYNEQEKAEVIARYCAEFPRLQRECQAFSRGQPGHNYRVQYLQFFVALGGVMQGLVQGRPLEQVLPAESAKARAALDAIPIPATSVILESGTPFTTYCRLRAVCEVDATTSLTWLDAYVDLTVFHRYFSGIRSGVPVTLVTSEPGPYASKTDKQRWTEFLDISRLYAQERGPNLYRLIVCPELHDRWVVFDGKRIYSLGGSTKDAGKKDHFTLTTVEAALENLARIDKQVNSGTEYFGSNTPTHK